MMFALGQVMEPSHGGGFLSKYEVGSRDVYSRHVCIPRSVVGRMFSSSISVQGLASAFLSISRPSSLPSCFTRSSTSQSRHSSSKSDPSLEDIR